MPKIIGFVSNTKEVTTIIYTNFSQFNKNRNIFKYTLLDLNNFYYYLINKISINDDPVIIEQIEYNLI